MQDKRFRIKGKPYHTGHLVHLGLAAENADGTAILGAYLMPRDGRTFINTFSPFNRGDGRPVGENFFEVAGDDLAALCKRFPAFASARQAAVRLKVTSMEDIANREV